MTTIKSTSGLSELHVGGEHSGRRWVRIERDEHGAADAFPTSAILNALGAVPKEDLRAAREQMLGFRDGMTAAEGDASRWQTAAEENERWADEWKRKAEESEANASAQIETAGKLQAERDEWKARAQVAEAAMGEVIRAVADHPNPCDAPGREFSTCGWKRAFQQVHAIVHPKPAFTLPTEPGAGIEADFTDGEKGVTFELRLFSDGVWIDNYGGQWGPEAVLSQMTGHRLISYST